MAGRPRVGPITELRLPAEWRDDLDRLAEEHGTSRAVLIRRAIVGTYGEALTPLPLDALLEGNAPGMGPRPRTRTRPAQAAA